MQINRRDFMRTSLLSATGVALADKTFAFGNSSKIIGSNDRINVAVVGLRSQGLMHINAYKSIPNVNIVALCDVDSSFLDERLNNLKKENINAKGYKDLREVYDNKDIDAVSIVTPNYWHALATVWACQAGKHVCVEKPVSHSIWEGRKMVEAARKYNRMVQADFDSRSNLAHEAAFDYMHKELGKVQLVRIVNYKRRKSIGKVIGPGKIPATVDYDLWTGPVPMKPLLRENLHYDWHWQWATGNSELGNNGPHQLDICRWGLRKKTLPKSVFSFGGRYGYQDDGEVPNTHVVWYDYDGIPVIYESRGLGETPETDNMDGITVYSANGKKIKHPYKGNANCSIAFICENGYIYENALYDNDGIKLKDFKKEGLGGPQTNFINALRTGKQEDLKSDIEEGHLSTSICHMGNISYQIGELHPAKELIAQIRDNHYLYQVYLEMEEHLRKHGVDLAKEQIIIGKSLTMDSRTERFAGEHSTMANLFIKDTYREPFIIPNQI
ncbi:MAG: Gfo/Idh/MocA family oxidoreductase [Prolixibacteraceae bacterium]|nr:Gfo/Idh/MocA family oxidoreductase [Prolixibacteraceae bacterium]